MGFTEKDAMKIIGEAMSCNNPDVLDRMLNGINPNIFSDKTKQSKLIEALNTIRQSKDVEKCHQLLGQILELVTPTNTAFVKLMCSKIFTDNFKRLSNLQQAKAINIINGIVHDPMARGVPIGDFIESPHGAHFPIRVFWYRDRNALFIVDVYHKNNVDSYYKSLRNKTIRKDYYREFVDLKSIIPIK